jgi:iron uptake system component EfeO
LVKNRKLLSRGIAFTVAAAVAVLASACSSSTPKAANDKGSSEKTTTVSITLTANSCTPSPKKVETGDVQFNVKNLDADSVSEAELRTSNLSHLLGEQENLTPGLSGGFELTVEPGQYVISCPGARQPHAPFVVIGSAKSVGSSGQATLDQAVSGYATYVGQQSSLLVSSTQTMCNDINAGSMTQAEIDYPKARIYYERIEPVASVWGTLDTAIDGRIDNPVTNPADLEGFHRIEELMWADGTLKGAAAFCSQLVSNEKQLHTLVDSASYNAVTMASGATDLINEAADSKITGEEERYSNTDFIVFQANVDGRWKLSIY